MKFIKIAALVAVLFFSVMAPIKSDPHGGMHLFDIQWDAITFCSQEAVYCENITYWIHPVAGPGWLVTYTIVNPTTFHPPTQGTPLSGAISGGGGGSGSEFENPPAFP